MGMDWDGALFYGYPIYEDNNLDYDLLEDVLGQYEKIGYGIAQSYDWPVWYLTAKNYTSYQGEFIELPTYLTPPISPEAFIPVVEALGLEYEPGRVGWYLTSVMGH